MIDTIKTPKRSTDKSLRLPLQYVYKIQGIMGTVPVGRVETDVLKPDMIIRFSPTVLSTEYKSVDMYHETKPGDNVECNVKGLSVKQIDCDNVTSNSKPNPIQNVCRILTHVIVLNHKKIKSVYAPVLDCHTSNIPVPPNSPQMSLNVMV